MKDKNGTMESAIQDRLLAQPNVTQMNQEGSEAHRDYLMAIQKRDELKTKKDSLTLDEKKSLETLEAHIAQYEKVAERTRETLLKYNSRVMDNPVIDDEIIR